MIYKLELKENVEYYLFNNNQIINELNSTWNFIETKIARIKEKVEFKIKDILLFNNDSINFQDDLESKIKEVFKEEDRKLLNDIDEDDYLRRNIKNKQSKIALIKEKTRRKNKRNKLYIFEI